MSTRAPTGAGLYAEVQRLRDLIYGAEGFLEHCGPEGTSTRDMGVYRWNCMTCSGEIIGGKNGHELIPHAESCVYVRAKEPK